MRKDEMKGVAVINLNERASKSFPTSSLKDGHNLVKCGRLIYVVDFGKCLDKNYIDVYLFFNENYSKYDQKANLTCFFIKKDAWLSRDFFKKRVEIEEAVKLISMFKNNLYLN